MIFGSLGNVDDFTVIVTTVWKSIFKFHVHPKNLATTACRSCTQGISTEPTSHSSTSRYRRRAIRSVNGGSKK